MEVLKEVYTPQGATAGGGQVRVLEERGGQALGHRPFSEPRGQCFAVPRLRVDWSIQTQKSRVSVSFQGVYLRGTQDCPSCRGRMLIPKALRASYQELIFICDFASCYLEHVLMGRVGISSKLLGCTEWILRQQCYEVG